MTFVVSSALPQVQQIIINSEKPNVKKWKKTNKQNIWIVMYMIKTPTVTVFKHRQSVFWFVVMIKIIFVKKRTEYTIICNNTLQPAFYWNLRQENMWNSSICLQSWGREKSSFGKMQKILKVILFWHIFVSETFLKVLVT